MKYECKCWVLMRVLWIVICFNLIFFKRLNDQTGFCHFIKLLMPLLLFLHKMMSLPGGWWWIIDEKWSFVCSRQGCFSIIDVLLMFFCFFLNILNFILFFYFHFNFSWIVVFIAKVKFINCVVSFLYLLFFNCFSWLIWFILVLQG